VQFLNLVNKCKTETKSVTERKTGEKNKRNVFFLLSRRLNVYRTEKARRIVVKLHHDEWRTQKKAMLVIVKLSARLETELTHPYILSHWNECE
jgi:hypothetical protein